MAKTAVAIRLEMREALMDMRDNKYGTNQIEAYNKAKIRYEKLRIHLQLLNDLSAGDKQL